MRADEPILESKARRLCFECVGESLLRAEIERDGVDGTCFYCAQERKTLSIGQIADYVRLGLSEFFEPVIEYGPDLPAESDRTACSKGEEPQDTGRKVSELIKEQAGICETVAEDIRRILAEQYIADPDFVGLDETKSNESPFDSDVRHIKRASVSAWTFEGDWDEFEMTLKSETRFFNRTAEEILTTIFDGIDDFKTVNGRPVVVDAGPGTELEEIYRARVFQTEEQLKEGMKRPDKHVGPPPSSGAMPGRMNAAGIPVFYGATSAAVALAEVRPPVGSKVLVGCFKVVRTLKLLDLEALEFVAGEGAFLMRIVFID